jgi:hypothetical protein
MARNDRSKRPRPRRARRAPHSQARTSIKASRMPASSAMGAIANARTRGLTTTQSSHIVARCPRASCSARSGGIHCGAREFAFYALAGATTRIAVPLARPPSVSSCWEALRSAPGLPQGRENFEAACLVARTPAGHHAHQVHRDHGLQVVCRQDGAGFQQGRQLDWCVVPPVAPHPRRRGLVR